MGKARNVYFKYANLWAMLDEVAKKDDRSVNYVIEKILMEYFNKKARK